MPIPNTLQTDSPFVLGCWQTLPGAFVTTALTQTGIKWILLDCEHGALSDADMRLSIPMAVSQGVSPIVRIPELSRSWVKYALDSGAHGIMLPMINTAEDARTAVRWAKFPPQGERRFGNPFTTKTSGCTGQYLHEANDGTSVIVQIETREGLENLDAIAAVDGVDVLFLGPYDLSISLGLPVPPEVSPPRGELLDAMKRVLDAAKRNNKRAAIYCSTGTDAKRMVEMGFWMVSVAGDAGALKRHVSGEVMEAMGAWQEPALRGPE